MLGGSICLLVIALVRGMEIMIFLCYLVPGTIITSLLEYGLFIDFYFP